MNTSIARYALGAVALAIVCGALAIAAVAVRRRTLPDWTGAPARLAEVVIGLALLIAILEVLGAIGLFELGPIVIACGLAGVAGVREVADTQMARRTPGRAARRGRPRRRPWWRSSAAPSCSPSGARSRSSPTTSGSAGSTRSGTTSRGRRASRRPGTSPDCRFTDVEYLTPFYPATAEMLHGLGIVLLGRDTLSPGLNLAWLGLSCCRVLHRPPARGRRGHDDRRGAGDGHDDDGLLPGGRAANDVVAVFFLLAAVALLVTTPSAGRQRRAYSRRSRQGSRSAPS